MVKNYSHCIMGGGYASLISQYILKEKGIEAIIIKPKKDSFFDLNICQDFISPIPIFPVRESKLFVELNKIVKMDSKSLEVSFANDTNEVSEYPIYEKNSLAAFLIGNSKNRKWFDLSLKQWGGGILTEPYSEIQKKINRHYISNNGNSRVGYKNGLSFYRYFIDKVNCETIEYNDLEKLDYENKELHFDNKKIRYEKLISTIPLPNLFKVANYHNPEVLSYAGSYFFFYSFVDGWSENKMIYDCKMESDILRVFSVSNKYLMVQLPSHKYKALCHENVGRRVKELIPKIEQLMFQEELYLPVSYPTESIQKKDTLDFIELLKANGVVTFGRFGNWEYKDLHELNWADII